MIATAECEESDTATLTSRVLRTVELTSDPDGHQPWAIRGATTVDSDADPGTYEVGLQCGTQRATAALTVLSDGAQVTRAPVGAPETGAPDPQRPVGALLVGALLVGAALVAAVESRRGRGRGDEAPRHAGAAGAGRVRRGRPRRTRGACPCVRADGTTAVFTVTRLMQVPKSAFPTDAVYGDTAAPELRLITCGGELDTARRSYRDNIIVFAMLTGTRAA